MPIPIKLLKMNILLIVAIIAAIAFYRTMKSNELEFQLYPNVSSKRDYRNSKIGFLVSILVVIVFIAYFSIAHMT